MHACVCVQWSSDNPTTIKERRTLRLTGDLGEKKQHILIGSSKSLIDIFSTRLPITRDYR